MPLKQISVKDREMQTIQTNTATAITNLETATQLNLSAGSVSKVSIMSPFTGGGHLLTGVLLTPGQDNLIAHKLTQTPLIWVVCGVNVNTTIWSPVSSQLAGANSDAQYLNLQCTNSPATVTLWVA